MSSTSGSGVDLEHEEVTKEMGKSMREKIDWQRIRAKRLCGAA